MKTIALGDVFTQEQLDAALKIWNEDRDNFHQRVLTEITTPALPRINEVTGQENDARYWAYALEYTFGKIK